MKLPKALFPDVFKFWTQHDNLNDELNYAASTGDLKMIDMILKMLPDANPNVKVKINARDRDGVTALDLAVRGGNGRAILMLIFCGARVEESEELFPYWPPFILNITHEDRKLSSNAVRLLMDRGCNPESSEINGLSAIHYAARHSRHFKHYLKYGLPKGDTM